MALPALVHRISIFVRQFSSHRAALILFSQRQSLAIRKRSGQHAGLSARGSRAALGGKANRQRRFSRGNAKAVIKILTVLKLAAQSISIPAGKHAEQSHGDDLQIEGQAPVAEVVQIVFHALGNGGVASPAVDLGPSRNSSLEHMTGVVTIKFLQ